MEYTNITVETRENLGIITLNRPQALNAVNAEMLKELALAAEAFDNNLSLIHISEPTRH